MLLRSSSTPILGSMIQNPSHSDYNKEKEWKANVLSEHANRFCFGSTNSHTHLHASYDTCSVDEEKEVTSLSNFRRVRSEGNLENLNRGCPARPNIAAETFLQADSFDDVNLTSLNKPWSRRLSAQKRLPPLKSNASLSWYCNEVDEVEDESMECFADGTTLDSNMQEFSFGNEGMGKIDGGMKSLSFESSAEPMFMARGLGIDVMDPLTDVGGGRGNSTPKTTFTGGDGGDGFGPGSDNIEEYYQKMLMANPSNSLLMRNYAHFLYETKHDYQQAEEYYTRAILAQPDDGDVLAQYAKLIWEVYGDEERASAYFEQAVQASPADSCVLASYASFLWNIDGEEKEEEHSNLYCSPAPYGTVGAATTTVQ